MAYYKFSGTLNAINSDVRSLCYDRMVLCSVNCFFFQIPYDRLLAPYSNSLVN